MRFANLFDDGQFGPVGLRDAHGNDRLGASGPADPGGPADHPWQCAGPPTHVEVVDLDADGIRDCLVASIGSDFRALEPADSRTGSIIWLRGDSSGRFQPITLFERLGRVADAQAADFDADGDLDIVVAVFGWRTVGGVLYLENQTTDYSDPQFDPYVLDGRTGPVAVPIVDLNQDGRPDIVTVIGQESETVVAFLNLGDGEFDRENPVRGAPPRLVLQRHCHPPTSMATATRTWSSPMAIPSTITPSRLAMASTGWRTAASAGSPRIASLTCMAPSDRRWPIWTANGDLDIATTAFMPHVRPNLAGSSAMASVAWLEQTSPREVSPSSPGSGDLHAYIFRRRRLGRRRQRRPGRGQLGNGICLRQADADHAAGPLRWFPALEVGHSLRESERQVDGQYPYHLFVSEAAMSFAIARKIRFAILGWLVLAAGSAAVANENVLYAPDVVGGRTDVHGCPEGAERGGTASRRGARNRRDVRSYAAAQCIADAQVLLPGIAADTEGGNSLSSPRRRKITVPVAIWSFEDLRTLRKLKGVQLPRRWPLGERLPELKQRQIFPTGAEAKSPKTKGSGRWLEYSDEDIWAMQPDSTIPRWHWTNIQHGCPVHGKEIYRKRAYYPWHMSSAFPWTWKIRCPVGNEEYPSNDFANGDMTSGPFPDDGIGGACMHEGQKYGFIAELCQFLLPPDDARCTRLCFPLRRHRRPPLCPQGPSLPVCRLAKEYAYLATMTQHRHRNRVSQVERFGQGRFDEGPCLGSSGFTTYCIEQPGQSARPCRGFTTGSFRSSMTISRSSPCCSRRATTSKRTRTCAVSSRRISSPFGCRGSLIVPARPTSRANEQTALVYAATRAQLRAGERIFSTGSTMAKGECACLSPTTISATARLMSRWAATTPPTSYTFLQLSKESSGCAGFGRTCTRPSATPR